MSWLWPQLTLTGGDILKSCCKESVGADIFCSFFGVSLVGNSHLLRKNLFFVNIKFFSLGTGRFFDYFYIKYFFGKVIFYVTKNKAVYTTASVTCGWAGAVW